MTSIRPFADQDAAQVRDLFITVNRLLSPANLRGAFEAYIKRALEEEIDRIPAYYGERDGGFWVAVRADTVIGTFGLERASADAFELRRMYVDPAARRQGIARQMLRRAEHECRERNASRLELSTAEIQHGAIELYKNADTGWFAQTSSMRSAINRWLRYTKTLLRKSITVICYAKETDPHPLWCAI
jgi:GNAT superfamily N-acetyltransferase